MFPGVLCTVYLTINKTIKEEVSQLLKREEIVSKPNQWSSVRLCGDILAYRYALTGLAVRQILAKLAWDCWYAFLLSDMVFPELVN
ncbi:hypothetical protein L596_026728 [Steinernema carpocapsae]|uniref:Uncharacterized protein n=1 Tax=Steinernema carpocapsae TaxID=34508 RepID=A0A4U5M269_STECR|nr:hypothetical protein L596_026728 [Steinernema carpocapsae]